MKKKAPPANPYPYIALLGLDVKTSIEHHISWVEWEPLTAALKARGLEEQFNKMIYGQTCVEGGPYPWDVEPILRRMLTLEKTGTQLHWD